MYEFIRFIHSWLETSVELFSVFAVQIEPTGLLDALGGCEVHVSSLCMVTKHVGIATY